jgi:hypothetical protein
MNVTINFANKSSSSWTLAIYLTLPGFDSDSWKQMIVPLGGSVANSWDTETLSVAIGSFTTTFPRIYTTSQVLSAELGSAWKIVSGQGVLELSANGSALLPTQIQILDGAGQPTCPGLGVDGTGALFRPDLPSGATAVFDGVPAYWVAAFDNIQQGQLITTSVDQQKSSQTPPATTTFIGPQPLDFSQGTTAMVSLSQSLVLDVAYQGASG